MRGHECKVYVLSQLSIAMIKMCEEPAMVIHTCNPNAHEDEAGEWAQAQDLRGLPTEWKASLDPIAKAKQNGGAAYI